MVTKSHGLAASAAVVLMLGVAGCTAPAPEPTSPVDSTPTPAPVAQPLAEGVCDDLLETVEVGSALGGSTTVNDYFSGPGPAQVAIVGGLSCRWAFGEQGSPDFTDMLLDIVPTAIADAGEIEASAVSSCEQGSDLMISNAGCLVDAAVGDWWYRLQVFTFGTAEAQSAATDALDGRITDVLVGATAPAPPAPLPGLDCAEAGTATAGTTSQRPVTLESTGNPILVAADRLARPTWCTFVIDGVGWTATVWPGSTVAFDLCVKRGDADVTVPGTSQAVAPPFDAVLSVCTSDGTSSVSIDGPEDGFVSTEWTEPLLATAGSLAAPLLALAST